jgi:hypothetical protein|tara:strand:- start:71 stop:256 length:186 start_codon:yes stop_codon:yes gene_type:complete
MTEKEMPEENKTVFYMIRTIDVLVENQKILLSRIKKLEDAMDMLADHIYDDEDEDEDRIIN